MHLNLSLIGDTETLPNQIKEHVFDERGGVIGRGDDCCWTLHCPGKLISRKHGAVVFEKGRFYLYDASSNGIYVNDGTDAVGPGSRVIIRNGDTFRMGDFVIRASLREVEEPTTPISASDPVGAASTQTVPTPGAGNPLSQSQADSEPWPHDTGQPVGLAPIAHLTRLGGTQDAFVPPTAVIPEDWDFVADLAHEAHDEPPARMVTRKLNSLQPAAAIALLEGLGIGDAEEAAPDLTPHACAALARCVSLCFGSAIGLRAEIESVQRRLGSGTAEALPQGESALQSSASAEAFFKALVQVHDDDARERLVANLEAELHQLRRVHSGMVRGLWRAFAAAIEKFSPASIETHVLGDIPAGGWRRAFYRIRRRATPGGVFWRRYQGRYPQQRNAARELARQVFEDVIERFKRRAERLVS
ncbi:MAG: FHA domain-containing protein [Aquisalimonadaceae bacterium]